MLTARGLNLKPWHYVRHIYKSVASRSLSGFRFMKPISPWPKFLRCGYPVASLRSTGDWFASPRCPKHVTLSRTKSLFCQRRASFSSHHYSLRMVGAHFTVSLTASVPSLYDVLTLKPSLFPGPFSSPKTPRDRQVDIDHRRERQPEDARISLSQVIMQTRQYIHHI